MPLIVSLIMAFSCFSAIPMPQRLWDERDLRYMMAAFPLVGVVIGALVRLWWLACQALAAGAVFMAAGLTLIPILVSGGIHMDGLADVIDALSSHASPERKREILKDPHVGAFATIGVGCYLLAYCALATEVDAGDVALLAGIPVVSRCLSALATVSLPTASSQGMLATEARSAGRVRGQVRLALLVLLALAAGYLCWYNVATGVAMVVVALTCLAWVARLARVEFGGMSGDLAGYFLQLCELAMLACLVLVGKVM